MPNLNNHLSIKYNSGLNESHNFALPLVFSPLSLSLSLSLPVSCSSKSTTNNPSFPFCRTFLFPLFAVFVWGWLFPFFSPRFFPISAPLFIEKLF